ncbi:hypothetical protein FLONG3_6880 [Fusarium longipes]|uniref:Uncharacterized protein n=1 Tax=Fusarium longipes TaxID=694270 RepID=A0A395SJ84_9HYPO|nr:hypothetical protein FLONG3_6880 [Fusarium longipes]
MLFKSFVFPALFAVARAAEDGVQLEYRTATITQCFTRDALAVPTPVVVGATCIIHEPAVTGGPIIVEVDAPNCESCGCPTCVHTVAYTTKYHAFCPTGLCDQEYVITERYSGLDAKPTMDSHSIPFGFTCDVQTCTTCGSEPVVATITYPVKDRPYINSVAHPTVAPSSGNNGDYDYGSKYDNEPNSPDVHVPAKKPEGEAMPVPKPTENYGFHSSVKPTSVPVAEESAHPGYGSEHPVIVSGAAGRDVGIASVGMAFLMLLLCF